MLRSGKTYDEVYHAFQWEIHKFYNIGAEIEHCLMKYPSVAMTAVVGSPDKIRTEIVKAFIVLKPDVKLSPEIDQEIKGLAAAAFLPPPRSPA